MWHFDLLIQISLWNEWLAPNKQILYNAKLILSNQCVVSSLPVLTASWVHWCFIVVSSELSAAVVRVTVFILYIMLDLSMVLWEGNTHSLSILLPLSWHAAHRLELLCNPVSCLEVSFIKAVDGHPLVVFRSKTSIHCEHPVAAWNQ